MKELKKGQIAVDRKNLEQHCRTIKKSLKSIDDLMTQASSVQRGRNIAKFINDINYSTDLIWKFELGKDL